ncbi:MAG: FAD-binding oxidoreductase [Cytophagaceae bacterium]|jgi:glycine/D-amino acid oxidase-like deaminating enzyme|nr:FAD-binding oxidoreductase [Cytophagaceae bacterium]
MGKKVDFIIIGGGLAGTCLALQLDKAGKRVMLVHDDGPCASLAAAGLFNPITGKKMVKTWMADRIFPYLIEFYQYYEKKWNTRFLHFLPIYKPFDSFEEQNEFMGQMAQEAYRGFLDDSTDHERYKPFVYNDRLGFQTLHSGFLQVADFLKYARIYLDSKEARIQEHILDEDLVLEEDKVLCKGIEAKALISCQGMGAKGLALLNKLPLNASKGEVLRVAVPNFANDVIFNKNVFMVPAGQGEYKVGSTYNWKFENADPSDKGKQELSQRLQQMIRLPFEITDHWAGIRPASTDRRPILGKHPRHSAVYIFNGLGAKGVSLAPYFSEQMKELLLNGKVLDDSVNITRLKSLSSNN